MVNLPTAGVDTPTFIPNGLQRQGSASCASGLTFSQRRVPQNFRRRA